MEDKEFPKICEHDYKIMSTIQTTYAACMKCLNTEAVSIKHVNELADEQFNARIEELENENYNLQEKLSDLIETYYELTEKIDSLVNNAQLLKKQMKDYKK